jgi:hypothetical protein
MELGRKCHALRFSLWKSIDTISRCFSSKALRNLVAASAISVGKSCAAALGVYNKTPERKTLRIPLAYNLELVNMMCKSPSAYVCNKNQFCHLGFVSNGRARLRPSRELEAVPRLSRSFALPAACEFEF